MTSWLSFVLAVAAGLLLAGGALWMTRRWLTTGPGGDATTGLLWRAVRGYTRLVHRASYVGTAHVPDTNEPGGMIVVSNHTGPIDPLLIQAACRFQIRWMMATDMMTPRLDWLWRKARVIPVERFGRDSVSAREAIRHVRGGGVIGIFPEGGIEQPRSELRPFHNGVGLIIARTRAPVLLVWVSGTPESPEMLRALVTPSRARVQFVDRFEPAGGDPAAVTAQLRRRLADVSGWPLNDEPLFAPRLHADPSAA